MAERIAALAAIAEENAASSEEVSASTEEQSAALEEVAASAKALAQLAEELTQSVAHFRVEILPGNFPRPPLTARGVLYIILSEK